MQLTTESTPAEGIQKNNKIEVNDHQEIPHSSDKEQKQGLAEAPHHEENKSEQRKIQLEDNHIQREYKQIQKEQGQIKDVNPHQKSLVDLKKQQQSNKDVAADKSNKQQQQLGGEYEKNEEKVTKEDGPCVNQNKVENLEVKNDETRVRSLKEAEVNDRQKVEEKKEKKKEDEEEKQGNEKPNVKKSNEKTDLRQTKNEQKVQVIEKQIKGSETNEKKEQIQTKQVQSKQKKQNNENQKKQHQQEIQQVGGMEIIQEKQIKNENQNENEKDRFKQVAYSNQDQRKQSENQECQVDQKDEINKQAQEQQRIKNKQQERNDGIQEVRVQANINSHQPEQPEHKDILEQVQEKEQIRQKISNNEEPVQEPNEKQADDHNLKRINLTEENEPVQVHGSNSQEGGDKNLKESPQKAQKIIQFEQYNPKKQQKQKKQEKIIYNQTLLKRIQELQNTVKELRGKNKQSSAEEIEENNEDKNKTIDKFHQQKKSDKKKKQKEPPQIIHDQSVHGLVQELAKNQSESTGNQIKKPVLQEKRYKRRKVDLTYLMDKNMGLSSNIFNVTVGEIINPDQKHEEEREQLKKQIKNLRQKVLKLEQQKRSFSNQKQGIQFRRETASTGKKQICGKLVKVSQLKASRVSGFDDNQSIFKGNTNQFVENKSQRDAFLEGVSLKTKLKTNREQKEPEKDPNTSFRVRKPTAKSINSQNQIVEKPKNVSTVSNHQQDKATQYGSAEQTKLKEIVKKQYWWEQPFLQPLQIPDLPSPPTQFDSQQDLYTLGKLTFLAFGVNYDNSIQMNVKKYKNCVYFNLGEKNNILWYFDGRFYFGEWQIHLTGQGQKSGEGFQYIPGKYLYKGGFKEGKRNGYGKMKILNKEKPVIYQGNWEDGNKNGQGSQIDQFGIKYWGNWKQNKRDGFGRLKLDQGDYYEGNFQRGIKTGQGTQVFKNGDRYQGNYLANKFHGKGKYCWKNGSIYEGDFNHGIRSGQGRWRSSQSSIEYDEYEGEYQNDKKNGFGKYKWADGSEYEGFFKDDLKQGQGTIRYKNGKIAKLLWRNGQPMKKLFSEQQKQYREGQKSKQKPRQDQRQNFVHRNETMSSRQFSAFKQQ